MLLKPLLRPLAGLAGRRSSHAPLFCRGICSSDDMPTERTLMLANGVLRSDRSSLARAITLVESTAPKHHAQAQHMLTHVLQTERPANASFRLGKWCGRYTTTARACRRNERDSEKELYYRQGLPPERDS